MACELHVSMKLSLQTGHQNRPKNAMPRPDTNAPNITKTDTSFVRIPVAGLDHAALPRAEDRPADDQPGSLGANAKLSREEGVRSGRLRQLAERIRIEGTQINNRSATSALSFDQTISFQQFV